MEARRGRPTKAFLKGLKRPRKADYDRLVRGAIEAILSGSEHVLVAFPYTVKFPKGFPKGVLVEKTLVSNIYRVRARLLLEWLHEHGHTEITNATLGMSLRQFNKEFDIELSRFGWGTD
jgi:hypothetical protein